MVLAAGRRSGDDRQLERALAFYREVGGRPMVTESHRTVIETRAVVVGNRGPERSMVASWRRRC